MEYLQIWLLVVAALRVVGAVNGAFFLKNLKERVYGGNPQAVSPLLGRLFASWTMMSFTLCILCAYDLKNRLLMVATFVSFVLALFHFLVEHFIFGTSRLVDIMSPFIVASTSIVWIGNVLFFQ